MVAQAMARRPVMMALRAKMEAGEAGWRRARRFRCRVNGLAAVMGERGVWRKIARAAFHGAGGW